MQGWDTACCSNKLTNNIVLGWASRVNVIINPGFSVFCHEATYSLFIIAQLQGYSSVSGGFKVNMLNEVLAQWFLTLVLKGTSYFLLVITSGCELHLGHKVNALYYSTLQEWRLAVLKFTKVHYSTFLGVSRQKKMQVHLHNATHFEPFKYPFSNWHQYST